MQFELGDNSTAFINPKQVVAVMAPQSKLVGRAMILCTQGMAFEVLGTPKEVWERITGTPSRPANFTKERLYENKI